MCNNNADVGGIFSTFSPLSMYETQVASLLHMSCDYIYLICDIGERKEDSIEKLKMGLSSSSSSRGTALNGQLSRSLQ